MLVKAHLNFDKSQFALQQIKQRNIFLITFIGLQACVILVV